MNGSIFVIFVPYLFVGIRCVRAGRVVVGLVVIGGEISELAQILLKIANVGW